MSHGRHLHFVQALDPLKGGGMGAAALELHLEFLRMGVDSSLIATRDRAEQPIVAPGVRQLVRRGPHKAFFVPNLRRLVEPAVAEADVVHGHGFYVDLNRVVGSLAIQHHKKFVYHVHGIFEPWILARSRAKKRVAHLLFENANQRHTSLWRALNEAEVAAIRSQGIKAPVVVAPNGVNRNHSRIDRPRSTLGSARTILFLGRLHPKKGLDLLVQSWAENPELHERFRLRIVGPDEAGYRSVIEDQVRELSVSDTVELRDAVTGSEKESMLTEAALMILPSRSEGMPMTLQESMAAGVPVAATVQSNFPGIEAHGAGFECDATVDSISEVLHRIDCTSDTELEEMGQNGMEWMRQEFSWRATALKILDACDRIPE